MSAEKPFKDIVELLEFLRKMTDDANEASNALNLLQIAVGSGSSSSIPDFVQKTHLATLRQVQALLAEAAHTLLEVKVDVKRR